MCSLLNFSDMSKHSLESSFVVVVVGLGEGRGVGFFFVFVFFFFLLLDGKSVMSMFCNVMMLLLLYAHVCVTRTGWKTRPRPKTVILSINKSINQSIKSISLSLSLSLSLTLILPSLSNYRDINVQVQVIFFHECLVLRSCKLRCVVVDVPQSDGQCSRIPQTAGVRGLHCQLVLLSCLVVQLCLGHLHFTSNVVDGKSVMKIHVINR